MEALQEIWLAEKAFDVFLDIYPLKYQSPSKGWHGTSPHLSPASPFTCPACPSHTTCPQTPKPNPVWSQALIQQNRLIRFSI